MQEQPHPLLQVLAPQEAGHAEVEQPDAALAQVDDVGRMGSAWKKPSCEDLLEPAVGDAPRPDSFAPRAAEPAIAGLLRVGPSMRSMVSTRLVRIAPVDLGDAHRSVVGEVLGEALGVARLEDVVELPADGAGELLHHRRRREADVQPALEQFGELQEDVDVLADLPGAPGRCTLTTTRLAPGQHGSVHLADGGRGERLGVEALERLLEREAELLLDDLARPPRIEGASRGPAA